MCQTNQYSLKLKFFKKVHNLKLYFDKLHHTESLCNSLITFQNFFRPFFF